MIERNAQGIYTLPDLTYAFDGLEPYVDRQTMEIHHDKHHAAYMNKLNAALEGKDDLLDMGLTHLFSQLDKIDPGVQGAIRNQGGGYYNHCLFWQVMAPGGRALGGSVEEAIKGSFGDVDSFKTTFNQAAETRFGSGWAWLVARDDGKLTVVSTANQDNPLMQGVDGFGGTPILGLDVWEHAYYLKYQNRRPDYIKAWWNIVNWDKVNELFDSAIR